MRSEPFLPESTFEDDIRKARIRKQRYVILFVGFCLCVLMLVAGVFFVNYLDKVEQEAELSVPDITIQSMDFTVLNVTDQTHLNVKWDLLIRIPPQLPGYYMCLKGNFQVLILYKGATIAISSMESYTLIPEWVHQLSVSTIASEGDMDPSTVKDIVEIVKNKGDIRFGSRLVLPDCRYGTSGKMTYGCDEATLHFGSKRNATLFENYPNCVYMLSK